MDSLDFKMASFDKFTGKMRERLIMGHKKYGNDWLNRKLTNDMKEELYDLANYAYLLARRIEETLDKLDKNGE